MPGSPRLVAVQTERQATLNGRLAGRRLRAICRLGPRAIAQAVTLAELEGLTGRGTERLLRVARTIADLEGEADVQPERLDEAARFRAFATRFTHREAS